MKHLIAIFALAALLFASCMVQQEITFNKDFSGSTTVKLDLSGLFDVSMSMSGEEMPSDPDSVMMLKRAFLADFFTETDSTFNVGEGEGLENLTFTADTNDLKVNIMFQFENIDALNTAFMKNYEEEDQQPEFVIKRKNKTITYFMEIDTSQFSQMVQMETTMNFASPIKSSSHEEVMIEGNQAVFRSTDFKESTAIEITLK